MNKKETEIDNNKDEFGKLDGSNYKQALQEALKHIKLFFKKTVEIIKNQKSTLNKKKKEERYDVGLDDIENAYKKVPKRIGYIVIVGGLIIMIILTIIAVQKDISRVNDERRVVDENKTLLPDVEISIDEQSWKYHQTKRIDNVAKSVRKQLKRNKEELKNTAKEIKTSVSNDMNKTVKKVEGYIGDINSKINSLRDDISSQLTQTLTQVSKKLKDNQEFIRNSNTTMPSNNAQVQLDYGSKLLPPPLTSLDTTPKEYSKKDEKDENENEIISVEPSSADYQYDLVEIDDMDIDENDVVTSLYIDTNTSEDNKHPKLHIMKGLVNATLLTGVNAPTFGGGSNKNPAPVLFSVDGRTLIANNEYEVIDDCLIAGVATGNVNTARADILITELSCSGYDNDGNKVKIEQDVKGWAIGEDGSFGLQGRLLDSSGKVITKMIALEVIQGLTKALVAASQPVNTAVGLNSGTTPVNYGQSAQSGFGSGVSKGLDHAYDHYNEILTGMYPTISVRAGKKISLHLKGGEDLTPSYYESVDIYDDLSVEKIEEKR